MKRICTTIPDDLLISINKSMKEKGFVTRSEFIRTCIRSYLNPQLQTSQKTFRFWEYTESSELFNETHHERKLPLIPGTQAYKKHQHILNKQDVIQELKKVLDARKFSLV